MVTFRVEESSIHRPQSTVSYYKNYTYSHKANGPGRCGGHAKGAPRRRRPSRASRPLRSVAGQSVSLQAGPDLRVAATDRDAVVRPRQERVGAEHGATRMLRIGRLEALHLQRVQVERQLLHRLPPGYVFRLPSPQPTAKC